MTAIFREVTLRAENAPGWISTAPTFIKLYWWAWEDSYQWTTNRLDDGSYCQKLLESPSEMGDYRGSKW
jgi:hypothetical protein